MVNNIYKNKIKMVEIVAIILLFLFSSYFLNQRALYMFFLFLISIGLILKRKNIFISKELIYLLLFLFSYFIVHYFVNDKVVWFDTLLFLLSYLSGSVFINNKDQRNRLLYLFILSIALGFILHAILNVWYTLNNYDGYIDRNLYDFWSGERQVATHIGTWCIPILGLSYYAFFYKSASKVEKILKFIIIINIILAIYVNLVTATRTPVIVLIIIFILGSIIELSRKDRIIKKIRLVAFIFILFISSLIIFQTNTFGIKRLILDSSLVQRIIWNYENNFNLLSNARFERQLYALQHFSDSFFGGYNLREVIGQLHNFWLDTYDMVGFIPLIFLVIFTAYNLLNAYKLIKSNHVEKKLKYIVIGLYIAFYLQFMVEPIIEGEQSILAMYLFVCGCISKSNNIDKETRLKNKH